MSGLHLWVGIPWIITTFPLLARVCDTFVLSMCVCVCVYMCMHMLMCHCRCNTLLAGSARCVPGPIKLLQLRNMEIRKGTMFLLDSALVSHRNDNHRILSLLVLLSASSSLSIWFLCSYVLCHSAPINGNFTCLKKCRSEWISVRYETDSQAHIYVWLHLWIVLSDVSGPSWETWR